MINSKVIERIVSKDRFQPYLNSHNQNVDKAFEHYKINILISQSFYPLLAILEVGLRNSIHNQLSRKYNDLLWFDNVDFITKATSFHTEKIAHAKTSILTEKKPVTEGRIISELSFGFWTSLFDSRFEKTLWKNLRLAFPNCPKVIRKRKTMSTKFNRVRKFRNRIFHHEPISWNLDVLNSYKEDVIEGMVWLHKDLVPLSIELNHVDKILSKYRNIII